MATYPRRWALCGGWAVDAWLGRTTREHLDVDVLVVHEDQRSVVDHLRGWHLAAHDPGTPDGGVGWDGRELEAPAHVHARPPGPGEEARLRQWVEPPYAAARDGRNVELIFNEAADDALILSREPAIAVPWEASVALSAYGIPALVSQILLFWKATAYLDPETGASTNAKDADDFSALAPHLTGPQRAWLRDAIAGIHPAHAWLEQLA